MSDDPSAAHPITLPIRWTPDQDGPLRLVRQFGCPAIDPAREAVALRVEEVPGVLAIRLNDRPVALPTGPEWDPLELRGLGPRNELVLDVDPARALAGPSSTRGWGHIALVVRSAEGPPPDRRETSPTP